MRYPYYHISINHITARTSCCEERWRSRGPIPTSTSSIVYLRLIVHWSSIIIWVSSPAHISSSSWPLQISYWRRWYAKKLATWYLFYRDRQLLPPPLSSVPVSQGLPSHRHQPQTSSYRDSLDRGWLTVLMLLHLVLVEDMIGIEFTFPIQFFIGELALFKVIEEALIGHDVRGVERTLHRSHSFVHYYLIII